MNVFRSPRLWLLIWGAAGTLFVLYVIIAASVQSGGQKVVSQTPKAAACGGAAKKDIGLLRGEMDKFVFAPARRSMPSVPVELDGKPATLSDYRGQLVLVNFWASWCAPCLKELPSLDQLQQKRGGDDFAVVTVAVEPAGQEAAKAYFGRLGIGHLPLFIDPKLAFSSAVGGVSALPVSVLYDEQGNEIGRLTGAADWQSVEALQLIDQFMPCD